MSKKNNNAPLELSSIDALDQADSNFLHQYLREREEELEKMEKDMEVKADTLSHARKYLKKLRETLEALFDKHGNERNGVNKNRMDSRFRDLSFDELNEKAQAHESDVQEKELELKHLRALKNLADELRSAVLLLIDFEKENRGLKKEQAKIEEGIVEAPTDNRGPEARARGEYFAQKSEKPEGPRVFVDAGVTYERKRGIDPEDRARIDSLLQSRLAQHKAKNSQD